MENLVIAKAREETVSFLSFPGVLAEGGGEGGSEGARVGVWDRTLPASERLPWRGGSCLPGLHTGPAGFLFLSAPTGSSPSFRSARACSLP